MKYYTYGEICNSYYFTFMKDVVQITFTIPNPYVSRLFSGSTFTSRNCNLMVQSTRKPSSLCIYCRKKDEYREIN